VQTLTLTDIATWLDGVCAVTGPGADGIDREIRKRVPFPLLGFDTDNDSVFMNETVQSYCKAPIENPNWIGTDGISLSPRISFAASG
jgi:hypothetical protein